MPEQALTATLETTINKALSLDELALKSLSPLNGKVLSIKLSELPFHLTFNVAEQNVLVTTLKEHADCAIFCHLSVLSQIKTAQSLTQLIKSEQLSMEGDLKVAQQFASIAQHIDIDWQQQLSSRIGDVATYKLTRLGKQIKSKLDFAKEQISKDASEYLLYEKKWACTPSQVAQFKQQVTEVTAQANSLEARISQLIAATKGTN